MRAAMLDGLAPHDGEPVPSEEARADLVQNRMDGRIKLYSIVRSLHMRGAAPELFRRGAYLPLAAAGARHPHVFAFARTHEGAAAVTVVPRLTTTLVPEALTPPTGAVWADTRLQLPPAVESGTLMNIFTGERHTVPAGTRELPLAEVLRSFPVAVLTSG